MGLALGLKRGKKVHRGGGLEIYGIDGNSVDESLFYIPKQSYKQVDLTSNYEQILQEIKESFNMQKFDLVESLEVAEHFDEQYAENFIKLLTSLSDVVLFSAAIPYQGGTHHVNEQPPAYWAKLFAKFDFLCFDLRNQFWEDEKIAYWYRQNTLIYAHKEKAQHFINQGLKPVSLPLYLVRAEYVEFYYKKFKILENKTLRFYFRHPKKIFSIFKKD